MTMIIDQCPAGWNVIVDAKWLRVLAAASPPTEGVKLPKGGEAVRYRTDLFRPFSGQISFPLLGLSSFGFGTRLMFFLSSLQVFWVLDRDTRRLLVNTGSCLHGNFDSSFNYRHSVEWGRGLICWNNTSRWIGWLEFVIKVASSNLIQVESEEKLEGKDELLLHYDSIFDVEGRRMAWETEGLCRERDEIHRVFFFRTYPHLRRMRRCRVSQFELFLSFFHIQEQPLKESLFNEIVNMSIQTKR